MDEYAAEKEWGEVMKISEEGKECENQHSEEGKECENQHSDEKSQQRRRQKD